MEQIKKRTSMSVMEMGKMLGLGKTESYWLVKKNYFKTITVGNSMRVMISSFEDWYDNQCRYRKVDGTPPGSQLKQTTMDAAELGNLLGIAEASAYELIAKGHFEKIDTIGKLRITNDSFWSWYSSQSFYRTVEDQEKDKKEKEDVFTLPQVGKLLGLCRNRVYYLVSKGYFDVVQIGRYKCITKESFYRWYNNQTKFSLIADAINMEGVNDYGIYC